MKARASAVVLFVILALPLFGGAVAPGPREVAAMLPATKLAADVDIARRSMLAFIRAFKDIPAEKVDPRYRERVARVERHILAASPQQLAQLNDDLQTRMPEWSAQLSPASGERSMMRVSTPRTLIFPLPPPDEGECADNFTGVLCEIEHIITDVGAFFDDLPGFATEAVTDIIDIFTDLVNDVPTSLNGLIHELGIEDVNFNAAAQAAQSYPELPCPAVGANIPGIGRVGTIQAWANHTKGVGFAGNTLQDIAPTDIITGLNAEAGFALVNFPVQWLGTCLEAAWQAAEEEAQAAHHDLVTARLDVTASSRATQTNVDTTQAQTTDIDVDVARLEGKTDVLNTTATRTEATSNRIIGTTDATEANANVLETTSVRLDTTASRLEGKVDNLQVQQDHTTMLLETMKADYLQMLIENDLLRSANTRISLFQLPASAGGLLDTVQSHVIHTIQVRESAGVDVKAARKSLLDAQQQLAAHNYKSAYTHLRTAYQRAVH